MKRDNSLQIEILSIPHSQQRYETCGDYFTRNGVDIIAVSELPDRRETLLVAIHELIEMALCQIAGISNASIDRFDMSPEYSDYEGEPGDLPAAPYYRQHQIATGIERLLAAEMGVDWLTYERHIQELAR